MHARADPCANPRVPPADSWRGNPACAAASADENPPAIAVGARVAVAEVPSFLTGFACKGMQGVVTWVGAAPPGGPERAGRCLVDLEHGRAAAYAPQYFLQHQLEPAGAAARAPACAAACAAASR